jgi:hypothetical protein
MVKRSDADAWRKREKVQSLFWSRVGASEHISVPMLEDAIRKEFKLEDDRAVQSQVNLMQTEARIRVKSRVKVWIKQPDRKL